MLSISEEGAISDQIASLSGTATFWDKGKRGGGFGLFGLYMGMDFLRWPQSSVKS